MDDLGINATPPTTAPIRLRRMASEGDRVEHIIGSKYIVMASAGRVEPGLDGWKKWAATLSPAMEKLRPAGLRAGYHNHQLEFKPLDGKRPIEVIAANTPKDVMLQFDLGTCVEVG